MEIKNILKTGYHVIVVTVALIEAFELGKNQTTLRVLSEKDLDVLVNFLEGLATLLKGIRKLMAVFGKLFESRKPP